MRGGPVGPRERRFSARRAFETVAIGALALSAIALATLYVIEAFTAPNPILRIVLRTTPVLPVAVWTLWFDRSRPLQGRPTAVRRSARVALLVLVMAFAVAILGFGLNWLYDPTRVI